MKILELLRAQLLELDTKREATIAEMDAITDAALTESRSALKKAGLLTRDAEALAAASEASALLESLGRIDEAIKRYECAATLGSAAASEHVARLRAASPARATDSAVAMPKGTFFGSTPVRFGPSVSVEPGHSATTSTPSTATLPTTGQATG